MNPIVDEVKREYGGRVEFEYVNMDDQPGKEKASEYGVIGYPNILILTSQGREYELLKGVVPKGALEQTLDGVLAQEG